MFSVGYKITIILKITIVLKNKNNCSKSNNNCPKNHFNCPKNNNDSTKINNNCSKNHRNCTKTKTIIKTRNMAKTILRQAVATTKTILVLKTNNNCTKKQLYSKQEIAETMAQTTFSTGCCCMLLFYLFCVALLLCCTIAWTLMKFSDGFRFGQFS